MLGPYGHDTSSLWTTGGYSDPLMHEEWFGMVDVWRNPKLIFTQLQCVPPCTCVACSRGTLAL
eukprot:6487451-Prymnesium_polylepis.1